MRSWSISGVATLGLISMGGHALAQTNTFPWPMNPPVGIGTTNPKNALHLNFSSSGHNDTAIIRLSNDTTSTVFGILGLMPSSYPYYSSISTGEDLILHEQSQGDLILTNFQSYSLSHPYGAIRMATTPSPALLPTPAPSAHDFERFTILPNGNVGIDLPPNASGLDSAVDQLQLGGGVLPDTLETDPTPGLTFYGGNRFEGMNEADSGGLFPADWRYINFNSYINHTDSSSSRFKRMARMGSCGISFTNRIFSESGDLELHAWPYSPTRGTNDFSQSTTLQLNGSTGLALWIMDTLGNHYHHLFDVEPPGDTTGGIRNTNGLSYFHTPLCITSDHGGVAQINFTNLPGMYPDIGDDTTWMLVVNGSGLMKELFILDSTWADYVFDPDYKLKPLAEVQNYIEANHHLPDIPSAKQMAKTGVPVGRTEAAITKQMEEMMLYIEQLNHKIEGLESEVKELKDGKEK